MRTFRDLPMISGVPHIGFDKLVMPAIQQHQPLPARELKEAPQQTVEQESTTVTLELSEEDRKTLDELAAIDRKVRAHEQAHVNVGRNLIISGPTYEFEVGPDGRNYAIAGEVQIDTSPARTPEETIPKAQHIRATALAPPEPSPQDQRVAAIASQLEMRARSELATQQAEGETSSAGRSSVAAQAYQSVAGMGEEVTESVAEAGVFALA